MKTTIIPLAGDTLRSATTRRLLGFGTAAACALVLMSGCGRRPIVVQAPPATVIHNPAPTQVVAAAPVAQATPAAAPSVVVLREAPPPPRYEPMSPQPASDHVWIPGYWAWRGGRQEWVSGHWEVPPHPGARWVSPRWERQGDGYVFQQGYWQ